MSPTTGTPSIERPCLRGSSSTMTTGTRSASRRRRISRTIVAPASPAPTTATRVADRVSDGGAAAASQPALEADGAHHHRGDERAEQRDRAGHRQGPGRVDQEDDGPGRRAGEHDAPRLGHAGVLPDLAVQPPRQVGAELHEDDDRAGTRTAAFWYCDGMLPLNRTASSTRNEPATSMTSTSASGQVAAQSAHEPSPTLSRSSVFSPSSRAERAQPVILDAPSDAPIQFSAVRSCSLSAHLVVPADDTGPVLLDRTNAAARPNELPATLWPTSHGECNARGTVRIANSALPSARGRVQRVGGRTISGRRPRPRRAPRRRRRSSRDPAHGPAGARPTR